MESRPENPFKGLQPYQQNDRDRLFGRDKDVILIKSRIFSARTTLLFAGSGVGKTSFLNAKVIPELEGQFYICYHNLWSGPLGPLDPDVNLEIKRRIDDYLKLVATAELVKKYQREMKARSPILARTEKTSKEKERRVVNLSSPALPELLRHFCKLPPDFEKYASGCLLILDQFEEVFQYHSYQDYFKTFLYNLSYIINRSDLPVRVVFSMREEFLGELSIFDNRIPDLFNNYYRLKYPDKDDARGIIKRTCEWAHVGVDEQNLALLVKDLSKIEKGAASVAERSTKEKDLKSYFVERDFVIPPYLQIACHKLWNNQFSPAQNQNGTNHANKTFPATYKEGDAHTMLRAYLDEKLVALSYSEKNIAAQAFNFLVTKQGAKMAYELTRLAEHMGVNGEKLTKTLQKLSQPETKILRESKGPDGSHWFELYHDMYGTIVDEWREKHLRRQKRRYLTVAGIMGAIILLIVASVVFSSFRSDEQQRQRLEASFLVEQAVKAESRQDRDKAIIYRLQALAFQSPDSEEAKANRIKIGYLVGNDYSSLQATYRPAESTSVSSAMFSADGNAVLTQSANGEIGLWDLSGNRLSQPSKWSASANQERAAPAKGANENANQSGKAETSGKTSQSTTNSSAQRQSPEARNADATRDAQRRTSDEPERYATAPDQLPIADEKLPTSANIRALVKIENTENTYLIAGVFNKEADQGTVYLWRSDTGALLGDQPLKHGAPLIRTENLIVRFSPDGKYIATEGEGRTSTLWKIGENSLTPVNQIKLSSYVNHVCFSRDSKYLLIASRDAKTTLWDLSGEKIKFTLAHNNNVMRAAFSPDGQKILTWDSNSYIRLWDTETGEQIGKGQQLIGKSIRTPGQVFLVTNLAEGTTVITRDLPDNDLVFWDSRSGQRLDSLMSMRGTVDDVSIHPNGQDLLVISNGIARRLSINPSPPQGKLISTGGEINDAALKVDGKSLITISDDKIQAWDAETAQQTDIHLSEDLLTSKSSYLLSADGEHLVISSDADQYQVLNLINNQYVMKVPAAGSYEVSQDGQFIATINYDENNQSAIWKIDNDKSPYMVIGQANAVAFGRDGKLISGGEDNQVRLWDLRTNALIATLPLTSAIADVQLSADGSLALIGCKDGWVYVWDNFTSTNQKLPQPGIFNPGSPIREVGLSPNGKTALIATDFWIHRFNLMEDRRSHIGSRLLSNIWWSPFRYVDQDGERVRFMLRLRSNMMKIEDINFGISAEAQPFPGDPKELLRLWSRRLNIKPDIEH